MDYSEDCPEDFQQYLEETVELVEKRFNELMVSLYRASYLTWLYALPKV